jgi:flagellar capping protein FliD
MEIIMSVNLNLTTVINNLTTNDSYRYSYNKTNKKYNEDADNMVTYSSDFRHALKRLANIDTDEGATASTKTKINSFINSYNELMSSYSGVSGSKKLTTTMDKLNSLIDEYSDKLKSVGITQSTGNKLKLDTTTYAAATSEKLAAVFGKDSTFLSDAIKYTKKARSLAQDSVSTSEVIPESATVTLSASASVLAQSSGKLTANVQNLLRLQFTNTDDESIASNIKKFIDSYNDTINNAQSGTSNSTEGDYVRLIKAATANNSDKLNSVGITADSDGALSVDDDKLRDTSKDTLSELFDAADAASYGSEISSYSKKLFASLIKADSSGLNVNYYA